MVWFPCPFLTGDVDLSKEVDRGSDRVAATLTFTYDREADILSINARRPYAEQESDELGDDVIARFNPATGEIENLEVLFFWTRLLRSNLIELPVTAELRLAGQQ